MILILISVRAVFVVSVLIGVFAVVVVSVLLVLVAISSVVFLFVLVVAVRLASTILAVIGFRERHLLSRKIPGCFGISDSPEFCRREKVGYFELLRALALVRHCPIC